MFKKNDKKVGYIRRALATAFSATLFVVLIGVVTISPHTASAQEEVNSTFISDDWVQNIETEVTAEEKQAQAELHDRNDPETKDATEIGCMANSDYGFMDAFVCFPATALNFFASLVFNTAQWYAGAGGWILDKGVSVTTNSTFYNNDSVVVAWGIFRDLVNMLFIFVLLYIGLLTILQATTFDTKKTLVSLIIVALLLNFSFFFTGFIIDMGNTLGLFIYDSMTPFDNSSDPSQRIPIANTIAQGLQLSTLTDATAGNNITLVTQSMIYILGALVLFVAGSVMLSAGIMFLLRSVTLIFLLVLAPIAFAAWAVPGLKKHFSKWFGTLMGTTFVLPVYMLLLSIVFIMINGDGMCNAISGGACSGSESLGSAIDIGKAFSSGGAIFINYMLIIGFLIFVQKVSQSMAGNIATMSQKWAGKVTGAGLGVAAFGARHTIGRAGTAVGNSAWLSERAADSKVFQYGQRAALGVSKSSFDLRSGAAGSALGALGGSVGLTDYGKAGGKGGHEKSEEEAVKRKEAQAKQLSKPIYRTKDREDLEDAENDKTAHIARSYNPDVEGAKEQYKEELDRLDEEIKKQKVAPEQRATDRKRRYADRLGRIGIRPLDRLFGSINSDRIAADKIRKEKTDLDKLLSGIRDQTGDNNPNPPIPAPPQVP